MFARGAAGACRSAAASAAEPGRPDPADAPLVIRAIETAVADVRAGRAAALVTNPINKDALYRAGFRHPGHTEFLAELAGIGGRPGDDAGLPAAARRAGDDPSGAARGRREAVGGRDRPRRARDARRADPRFRRSPAPVIAVAGLNPHAGEGGALGREDIEIIAPAVAGCAARASTRAARSPADTMFHAAARRGYDAALCMYHDQALIPIKTIDFDGGGQCDAGPAVHPHLARSRHRFRHRRHAASARPDSLIAALELAAEMAARRAARRGSSRGT